MHQWGKRCIHYLFVDYGNCLECNENYTFIEEYQMCYEKCFYYYYFDKENNYNCTITKECPKEFNKLIEEKKRCVDKCSKNFKYEFKNKCYRECPINTKTNGYYCEIQYPEELPYEILETQECVKNCSINDITKKICRLNNQNIQKDDNLQEEIVNNFQENLISGELNTSSIENGEDIVINNRELQ